MKTSIFQRLNPNHVSAVRLVLVVPIVILFDVGTVTTLLSCLVLMLIGEVSDIMDGRLARRYGRVSDLGKIFDPYCDSVSRYLLFLKFMDTGIMPFWMVSVMFVRDVTVAYLRAHASNCGWAVAARTSGKIKAVVQAIAQYFVVLAYLLPQVGAVGLPVSEIFFWSLLVATAVTAWSLGDYILGVMKGIPSKKPRLREVA